MRQATAALERVGQTEEDHARWIISQVHTGPSDKLASEEQEALSWEIAVFLNPGLPVHELLPVSLGEVKKLQPWLYGLLRELRQGKSWPVTLSRSYSLNILTDGPLAISLKQDCLNTFKEHVCQILNKVKARIWLCKRRGCRHFFYRRKRQEYCSKRCTDSERQERHRKKSTLQR